MFLWKDLSYKTSSMHCQSDLSLTEHKLMKTLINIYKNKTPKRQVERSPNLQSQTRYTCDWSPVAFTFTFYSHLGCKSGESCHLFTIIHMF